MRQKNRWRKYLSAALAAAMTMGMTATGTFAAESHWANEDGVWYYYNSKGEKVKDQVKKIQGKWYSFDEDGAMRQDEMFLIDDSWFYAFPGKSGELASSRWVLLNEEGHLADDEEGGSWYYFKEISQSGEATRGGRVEGEERKIQGKWYSFGDDGVMKSDEFFEVNEHLFYANVDGHLEENGWVVWSEPGRPCQGHEGVPCDCQWYYFKQVEKTDGGLKGGQVRNEIRTMNGLTYDFTDSGAIVQGDWHESPEDGLMYYYQMDGARAVSKWLALEDTWYHFDEKGQVYEYAGAGGNPDSGAATASNAAPARTVRAIRPVKDEVTMTAGQKKTFDFKIELATDSNAKNQNFTKGNHDMSIYRESNGTFKSQIAKVTADGVCTVQISDKYDINEGGEKIWLKVDDVLSEPVTLITELEEGKDKDVHTVEAILKGDYQEINDAVTQLKQSYEAVSEKEEEKADVQNQLLSSSVLTSLEKAYIERNRVSNESPDVAEEAKENLGSGEVTVTGGALNAPPGQSVQLKVEPSLEGGSEDEDKVSVSFDITLLIGVAEEKKEQSRLELPVVITMPLPKKFGDIKSDADAKKAGMLLINHHDDEDFEVPITIKGGKVSFVTDRFSTYEFIRNSVEDSKPEDSGSGSNSSASSTASTRRPNTGSSRDSYSSSKANSGSSQGKSSTGKWIQDSTGWWYQFGNGSYPANSWQYLQSGGVSGWYRFNARGYMATGWFTDTDGHIYYLNPVSNGTQGSMVTGWQQIDGQWYYFNPAAGGPLGSLLVNTTTPDGYRVNEKGQRVQQNGK